MSPGRMGHSLVAARSCPAARPAGMLWGPPCVQWSYLSPRSRPVGAVPPLQASLATDTGCVHGWLCSGPCGTSPAPPPQGQGSCTCDLRPAWASRYSEAAMTTAASSSRASSPSGPGCSLETRSPPPACAPSAHGCCSPQLPAPHRPQSWCPAASPARSSWCPACVPLPSQAARRGRGPVRTPTPEDTPEDIPRTPLRTLPRTPLRTPPRTSPRTPLRTPPRAPGRTSQGPLRGHTREHPRGHPQGHPRGHPPEDTWEDIPEDAPKDTP